MATPIKVPKLGLSDETTLISEWLKKKGEHVGIGEPLLVIATDKSTFEVASEAEGVLLEIFHGDGEEVPVLSNVGVIGQAGEDISSLLPAVDLPAVDSPVVETAAKSADENEAEEEGGIKISPRARRTADRLHLDYRSAQPSGAEGRIMEKDVLDLLDRVPRMTHAAQSAAINREPLPEESGTGIGGRITVQDVLGRPPAKPTAGDYEIEPLTRMRKVIAQNMVNSLQNAAQLTMTTSFNASSVLQYRERVKSHRNRLGLENITIGDMILFAVSRTLLHHPRMNAHLIEDKMHLFHRVHLGLAVDTPKGLLVPTLFGSDEMSLNQISAESGKLAAKCREETILPNEMQGASFTLTNLGNLGIETFTPVLNPPQVGILGVGSIVHRLLPDSVQVQSYPSIGLSLTFDHRAMDGAPAARFLQDLTDRLEHFDLLLAR